MSSSPKFLRIDVPAIQPMDAKSGLTADDVVLVEDSEDGYKAKRASMVGMGLQAAKGGHHIHVNSGTTAAVWKLLTPFIFMGTTAWGTLKNIYVLAARNSGTGTLRIYDPVNDKVIVQKSDISNEDYTIFSLGTLTNLPEDPVGLELQGKKVDVKEMIMVF